MISKLMAMRLDNPVTRKGKSRTLPDYRGGCGPRYVTQTFHLRTAFLL